MQSLLIPFLVLSSATFLLMRGWTLRRIQIDADGLRPFDLRISYTMPEAQKFLLALSEEGRTLYLGPQRTLDSLFIIFYSVLFLAAAAAVTEARVTPIVSAVVLLPGLADAVENALIAGMVRTGPGAVTEAQVKIASRTTTMKCALTAVAISAIAAGGFLF